MAAWFDEDERELWMIEYRVLCESHPTATAKQRVQRANTALAEVRALGVFDEPDEPEPPLTFEDLRTETIQDTLHRVGAILDTRRATDALDGREFLAALYEELQLALDDPKDEEEDG